MEHDSEVEKTGVTPFMQASVVLHFPSGATVQALLGGDGGEVDYVSQYAAESADGNHARAIRELCNIGVARGFGTLGAFEALVWSDAFGFPLHRLNHIVDKAEEAQFPHGQIHAQAYYEDGTPAANAHAEFDARRDKVFLAAVAEAERNGCVVAAAIEFLVVLGYAYSRASLPVS